MIYVRLYLSTGDTLKAAERQHYFTCVWLKVFALFKYKYADNNGRKSGRRSLEHGQQTSKQPATNEQTNSPAPRQAAHRHRRPEIFTSLSADTTAYVKDPSHAQFEAVRPECIISPLPAVQKIIYMHFLVHCEPKPSQAGPEQRCHYHSSWKTPTLPYAKPKFNSLGLEPEAANKTAKAFITLSFTSFKGTLKRNLKKKRWHRDSGENSHITGKTHPNEKAKGNIISSGLCSWLYSAIIPKKYRIFWFYD